MTKFKRDLQEAIAGNERTIIEARRMEIKAMKDELCKCKNNFRSQCLYQDITKRSNELVAIEAAVA